MSGADRDEGEEGRGISPLSATSLRTADTEGRDEGSWSHIFVMKAHSCPLSPSVSPPRDASTNPFAGTFRADEDGKVDGITVRNLEGLVPFSAAREAAISFISWNGESPVPRT